MSSTKRSKQAKVVTISPVGCGIYRIDGQGFANTLEVCLRECERRGWVVAKVRGS